MKNTETAHGILNSLSDLLRRVQVGEITLEKADTEAKLLESLFKGVETVEFEDRLSKLEKSLSEQERKS